MLEHRTLGFISEDDDHCTMFDVVMKFDPTHPLEVRFDFETCEWIFARDLLVTGVTEPSGVGDIKVEPREDVEMVALTLDSPSGHAEILIAHLNLREFLDATLDLAPERAEETLVTEALDRWISTQMGAA